MNIEELLSAIHAHYQKYSPESLQFKFFPPATPDEIDAAQTALGPQAPFPRELRELYLRYGTLLRAWGTISVMPVSQIPEIHQQLLDIAADYGKADPVGPVSPEAHTPTRIPFGADNDLTISIDLAPPAGGRSGQIVRLDLELGKIEVLAGSLQEFFEKGLEQLKSGTNT